MMKRKLYIAVRQAAYFLRWERPLYASYFDLVDQPSADAITLAFGPDVLEHAAKVPAKRRAAMLFPGFGCNPYHNLAYREKALATLRASYDLALANPGPLEVAYREFERLVLCPSCIDIDVVRFRRYRTRLDNLLHVSADYPQKDWRRSERVMQLSGLPYEVFPPRDPHYWRYRSRRLLNRGLSRANKVLHRLGIESSFTTTPERYLSHKTVVRRYQAFDGFVHIAAEVPDPLYIDGKYTTCLLEAGLTGAILFWHDTLQLGNTLETVFALPLDPEQAAAEIRAIRGSLDVERHSRRTREEMLDRFSPAQAVRIRCEKLLALA